MTTNRLCTLVICCLPSALAMAATIRLTFQVNDDSGGAVPNAEVRASTFSHHVPGDGFGMDKNSNFSALTDASGVAALEFSSATGDVGYSARKNGYYQDRGADFLFSSTQSGQWQPWNLRREIVLKPVIAPLPLFAKRVDMLPIPAQDTPAGYDLMVGDWVAPHGRGTNTDFTVYFHSSGVATTHHFDLTLTLGFPNPGDGLQKVAIPRRQGSVLRLRTAPESGYAGSLVKHVFRVSASTPINLDEDLNANYYFRVRTRQANGQISSAMYGKFYGDFVLTPSDELRFTYYLNPTPNSRNLEFNTKSNLLKNLKSFEQPNEP